MLMLTFSTDTDIGIDTKSVIQIIHNVIINSIIPINFILYYLGIGKQGGDKQLRGYVDEFYIYNKTLSPVELKSLIESCKDMVLRLSFEKIQGNTTFDSSGLNNDAGIDKGFGGAPRPASPLRCVSIVTKPYWLRINIERR